MECMSTLKRVLNIFISVGVLFMSNELQSKFSVLLLIQMWSIRLSSGVTLNVSRCRSSFLGSVQILCKSTSRSVFHSPRKPTVSYQHRSSGPILVTLGVERGVFWDAVVSVGADGEPVCKEKR